MRSIKTGMILFTMAGSSLFLLAVNSRSTASQDSASKFRNINLPVEIRAASLVQMLTLEEKVQQMQNNAPAIPRLGIPAYNWWNECLHGVARNGIATVFPQSIALAATFNPILAREEAEVISTEARAKYKQAIRKNEQGIYQGLTFWSPNINIFRDPRWGRGQETYGEDPLLTGRIGVAFVKGLQGDDSRFYKVIATAKHFAVHSGPEETRHSFDAWCSERDLFETYLPAFEALVTEGRVASVMGAYNRFWGEPCSASDLLLDRILRKKWGFSGYVTTDCGAIWDIYHGHHLQPDSVRASALALSAGSDLTCGNEYAGLVGAVQQGFITEEQIDLAVGRLFEARLRLGMFDPDSVVSWSAIPEGSVDLPHHHELARQVARESMVLLYNADQILPIHGDVSKIAVIGPYAASVPVLLGNYNGTPSKPVTLLEGIRKRAGDKVQIFYAKGVDPPGPGARTLNHDEASDDPQSDSALMVAVKSDVIVFVGGLSPELEGEELDINITGFRRGDRTTLDLPAAQIQLIRRLSATGKPVILVLTGGSAIAADPLLLNVKALLAVWYPGQEGGAAVADVLFGDYNPAGRLPVTFYRKVTDLPPFDDYTMNGRTYRYFTGNVLFPFGFGLSYTSFTYRTAWADKEFYGTSDTIRLSVEIANTGSKDGDEVVQVYMTKDKSLVSRPLKSLVGFLRIPLNQNETKKVIIEIPVRSFRNYDSGIGDFVVEPGDYLIQPGASSADFRLKTPIRVR